MVVVYISQLDTYASRNIGQVLSTSPVGATCERIHEDNKDDDDGGGQTQQPTPKLSSSDDQAPFYQVLGTFADPSNPVPYWARKIPQSKQREELLTTLLTCDVVIYDIREDGNQLAEASWVVQALHDQMSTFTSQKVFVCISTVLTWARTKPFSKDVSGMPFTEEDYRRRQSHPNFERHLATEKMILRLGKTDSSKFQTYVIACGLLYGQGEDILHLMFKTAWLGNLPHLKIYGNGQNVVPTIHVQDFARVVVNVLDRLPDTRYILAVDDSHNTLEEIVTAISKNLGTGKVQKVPKEEALMIRDLTQSRFDQLLSNLLVEPVFIKESMTIKWIAETGLVDNIDTTINEFRTVRNLKPIKVCVLGPPRSGKTTISKKLCQHYKLHYVNPTDFSKPSSENKKQADIGSLKDDSSERKLQESKAESTEELEEAKERHGFIDQDVIGLVKEKLKSMPCQNQGFVLDGFPESIQQASNLFARDDNNQEEEPDEENYNKLVMPDLVVYLQASYTFLRNRMQYLPQSILTKSPQYRDEDEELLERMKTYTIPTSLDYFTELRIRPAEVSTDGDGSLELDATVHTIKGMIEMSIRKQAFTVDQQLKLVQERPQPKKSVQELSDTPERLEQEQQRAIEAKIEATRNERMKQHLAEVEQEEKDMLKVQSIPMKNYLMRHVMPTLTQGLIQVCKVRPEDPIDYLAEYLFKENPQRYQ